jgi:DNA gyrase subunit B
MQGLAPVRKRPGMYIGDTEDGSGLRQRVLGVVANSLDQFLFGHCTKIDIQRSGDIPRTLQTL